MTYFHFIDSSNAIKFCQQHNDALHKLITEYPNRLAGLAALPMQNIAAACDELTRAVTELGLLGAAIGTDFGRPLDSSENDCLYERLVKLDVPLFIHPAPAGIDGPKGDANLDQYDLDIITGFAAQETLAIARLIYGGVLHRHPALDICVSHAGGAIPMLLGRLNEAGVKRPWAADYLRQDGAFEKFLTKLWFDTHVHDSRILDFVTKMLGKEHFLLGTNFAGWDQHDIGQNKPWLKRLADNARKILRADMTV